MSETIRNPQEILRQINAVFAKLEANENDNAQQLKRLSEDTKAKGIASELQAIQQREVLATEMIEQISMMLDHLGAQMTRQTIDYPMDPEAYNAILE